jgi:MoxR-like ATPase
VGTEVYRPQTAEFAVRQGPVFTNILLADEINRAPAKVQSALLQAMQERCVTIGESTFKLPDPFLVLATQNPIEQEGTYPLPEAQLDRFLMYVTIAYPDEQVERDILALAREEAIRGQWDPKMKPTIQPLAQSVLFEARQQVLRVHTAPALENYIVQLVVATRHPAPYDETLARWLRFGASPRATIALDRCSKAHAWLAGRDFVTPEDIHAVAHEVLRHRILLTYEAEAEGVRCDDFITELLRKVTVP